jgi:hypothetical protein
MRRGDRKDLVHARGLEHPAYLTGRREGDGEPVPRLTRAVPRGDHDSQADRVDEPQRCQVHHDPLRSARLSFEQTLAKLLVIADVARAGDQYDCCVSSLLEPDVKRLVEQMMRSDDYSFSSG